jgi:hypothetical protein
MSSIFTTLRQPVQVITKGGGARSFTDSRQLFAYLESLPRRRDSILSIQWAGAAISEDNIAGLETMLWLVGFETFKRASKRAEVPFSRFGTRLNWTFLGTYLGWEWRPLP